jgi:hypothetical protein
MRCVLNGSLFEVNHMPMLGVETQFEADLKSSVVKASFTIVGFTPNFRRRVMRRAKAETEERINGTTSLPLEPTIDRDTESRAAAERTDWRQLYPLLAGHVSAIETAVSHARTRTMASINNNACRDAVRLPLERSVSLRCILSFVNHVPIVSRITSEQSQRLHIVFSRVECCTLDCVGIDGYLIPRQCNHDSRTGGHEIESGVEQHHAGDADLGAVAAEVAPEFDEYAAEPHELPPWRTVTFYVGATSTPVTTASAPPIARSDHQTPPVKVRERNCERTRTRNHSPQGTLP